MLTLMVLGFAAYFIKLGRDEDPGFRAMVIRQLAQRHEAQQVAEQVTIQLKRCRKCHTLTRSTSYSNPVSPKSFSVGTLSGAVAILRFAKDRRHHGFSRQYQRPFSTMTLACMA
jgi:hypothetical protein